MSTKELTKIPGLPEEEVVVIKKLGYGSLNKLRSKSTKTSVNVQTGQTGTEIDLGEYMKWVLVFGIKSAKFFDGKGTSEERANAIDMDCISGETGEFLYKEIQAFNGFEQVQELKKK